MVLQNEHPTRVVKACQFHHVPKTTINSSFQSSNLSTIKILNVTSYWTKRVLNSFYFPHRKIEINTIEERGRDYIYRDIERGLEECRENGWWRWRREQFGIHSHLGCCCCLLGYFEMCGDNDSSSGRKRVFLLRSMVTTLSIEEIVIK